MEREPMRHSKALQSAGYEADLRILELHFRNGGVYDYFDVPPEVYAGLTASAHPWTEWQEHIKAAYRCEWVSG